jgi:hypothetical protein
MTTTSINIKTPSSQNVHIGDINGLYAEAAYHGLDRLRYLDLMDRTLAMHGDEVETLFPEVESLEASGGNLVTLHYALTEGGLSPRDFGQAVAAGIDLAVFTDALLLGFKASDLPDLLSRYSASELNGHLENFVDSRDGVADERLFDEF